MNGRYLHYKVPAFETEMQEYMEAVNKDPMLLKLILQVQELTKTVNMLVEDLDKRIK